MDRFEEPIILRCDIRFMTETIVLKSNIKPANFDKNQIINQIFEIQPPLCIYL